MSVECKCQHCGAEFDAEPRARHYLLCGDATCADDVARALADAKPHLMVTDPPYGVEYDPSLARPVSVGSARGKVMNDDRFDWFEAWALFPGRVVYVWHGMLHAGPVFDSMVSAGFEIRAEIIWAKNQLVMSRGHYHPQHESCWYAVRRAATANWVGDRKQTTLWQIDKPVKSETGHSTQKPVECMKRPIENNSARGDAVYDPFVGSGTTIIAAEMTGRSCHAIEISPAYCDVSIERWQNFTGEKATREGDGRSFDEFAANPAVCAA
jgi:DNA modification methylase